MIYTTNTFSIDAPVSYVFQYLANPKNCLDFAMVSSKKQEIEYLETAALNKTELEEGDEFSFVIREKRMEIGVKTITYAIVKNRKIHYKYIYTSFKTWNKKGIVDLEMSGSMLEEMNRGQMEGFWFVEDAGNKGTRVNCAIEFAGKVSFLNRISLWFEKRKGKKYVLKYIDKIIAKVESDFKSLPKN